MNSNTAGSYVVKASVGGVSTDTISPHVDQELVNA